MPSDSDPILIIKAPMFFKCPQALCYLSKAPINDSLSGSSRTAGPRPRPRNEWASADVSRFLGELPDPIVISRRNGNSDGYSAVIVIVLSCYYSNYSSSNKTPIDSRTTVGLFAAAGLSSVTSVQPAGDPSANGPGHWIRLVFST